MGSRSLLAVFLAGSWCACTAPLELSVDVRTDLEPGVDADAVVTRVTSATGATLGPTRRPLDRLERWSLGARAADFRDLPAGETRVEVTLESGGAAVLSRAVAIELASDYALTVHLDAACLGVRCEGARSECAMGVCVAPGCGGGDRSACGPIGCARDADCAALAGCAIAHCQDAMCVCDQRAGGLDAGAPEDAAAPGPDAAECACEGAATEEETRACGACDEGLERRTRACDGCAFGAWSSWGDCETDAVCAPGETQSGSRTCGNCDRGTQRRERACDPATCRWGAWSMYSACAGGGACAPGATRDGCDPCGHEVCSASCAWGACTPRSGSQCLRIRPGTSGPPGNNWRCCGTDRWQFCLDTCRWSTQCEPCSGCGCP